MKFLFTLCFSILVFQISTNSLQAEYERNGHKFISDLLDLEEELTQSSKDSLLLVYGELLNEVKDDFDEDDSPYDQHEYLFEFLHENYLVKYEANSLFSILLRDRIYDCVTGSGLYAALCLDLGMEFEIIEGINNILIIAENSNNKKMIVDITSLKFEFYKEYKIQVPRDSIFEQRNMMIFDRKPINSVIDSSYEMLSINVDSISLNHYFCFVNSNLAMSRMIDSNYFDAFLKINEAYLCANKYDQIGRKYVNISTETLKKYSNNLDTLKILIEIISSVGLDSNKFSKKMICIAADIAYKALLKKEIDIGKMICDSLINKYWNFLDTERIERTYGIYFINYTMFLIISNKSDEAFIFLDSYPIRDSLIRYRFYKDAYFINLANYLVVSLEKKKYKSAFKKVNSYFEYLNKMPEYQEVYLLSFIIQFSDDIHNHFKEIDAEIFKYFNKANKSEYFLEVIEGFYFEWSSSLCRENNYKDAVPIIERGLKILPESTKLKESLKFCKDLLK
jgi:hypothetical protein